MAEKVVLKVSPKVLPEDVLFKIFDKLPIDELGNMSFINKHWNQCLEKYLRKEFFDKKSLSFGIRLNQLPKIYRKCLNGSDSDGHGIVPLKRWNCADSWHLPRIGNTPNNLEICKDPDSTFTEILTNCPLLQSLDLNGLTIDLHFLNTINIWCPELECLYFNCVQIDSIGFYYFHKKIVSKLVHLSIDNMFRVSDWDNRESVWHQLFRNSQQLQDLTLEVYPEETQFDVSSLSQLCRDIVYIHINLFSTSDQTNPIRIKDVVKHLTEGNGRRIQFLRLRSDEEDIVDHHLEKSNQSEKHLNKFSDLRALNLSLKSKNNFDFMYELFEDMISLESLTLNFNQLEESQQLFEKYLDSNLKTNLIRLKLENIKISESMFLNLKTNYKHLVSLQLIDVCFENNNTLIEFLNINQSLSFLLLEYTEAQCEWNDKLQDNFVDWLSKSYKLNELYLINTPIIDSNKFNEICEQKSIELIYQTTGDSHQSNRVTNNAVKPINWSNLASVWLAWLIDNWP